MKRNWGMFALIITIFTGCASTKINPDMASFEKVVDFPNMSKEQIFDKSNIWAVKSFNKADSVIEYSDKDTGTIAGKFTYTASILKFGQNVDRARCILTLKIKDNKAKISISMAEIHINGAYGVQTWREPTLSEFKKLKFEPACEALAQDFEKTIKKPDTDW
jgi:hypothetical protein